MARFQRRSYQTRRKSRRGLRLIITLGIVALIGFGGYYAISESGILKIQAIIVEGDYERMTENEIIEIARTQIEEKGGVLTSDNVLAWDPDLALVHPIMRNFSLSRSLAKRIVTLHVTERDRSGIWCYTPHDEPEVCFWFDEEGILLERSPQTSGALITQIKDAEPTIPEPGKRIEPESFFTITLEIIDELKRRNLRFQRFELNRVHQELRAFTDSNTRVVFSLRFKPDNRIFDFLVSLKDEGQLEALDYIDMTVQNRIYTKES